MASDSLQTARESFGRCALVKNFFTDFYETFFASNPEIPQIFAKTDMRKQQDLLREGISFLLLYGAANENGKLAIERIGQLHDKSHVNVKPDMYRFWVQSLLETIEKHDPRYSPEVRAAWEEVIAKTINRFTELY
ncbi:MAG: globin [bacterium]|nr:globin [bacterium]